MTQPIDVAYVDIVARDKSLDKLRKDIDRTFDQVEKDVQKDLNKIDKDFDDAFDKIDAHFAGMAKTAEKTFEDLADLAGESSDEVSDHLEDMFDGVKHHFQSFGDEADGSFKRFKNKFAEPMHRTFEGLGDVIKNIAQTLGQLGSGIGGFVSSSPLLVLILALTPAIIALAAALSQLIGLVAILPGGIAVLLSAIIPVVVAFQNFGDAVSALASGDIEKIDEALKKLSPSAASVAREIAGLLPTLRAFQRVIQESFFSQVRGDFTRVILTTFPTIQKGFSDIAGAMGRLVSSFADLATSSNTLTNLRDLFSTTATIIDKLNPSFVKFTDMLLNTVRKSLPFIERMAGAFGKALDAFSAFVNKSIENGDFDKFVEDAITTVKELIDLVKSLGGLLKTLFAGTEDAGHSFIQSLTNMITKLDEFLKTAEGQEVITSMAVAVKLLAATLSSSLDALIFFTKSLKQTLGFFEAVGRGVVGFVSLMVEQFEALPELITSTIGAIPEMVSNIFNGMFDAILLATGAAIGALLFIFQELPDRIAAFLISLPQRLYAIFLQISPLIGLALQGAVDFGRNIIVNGFNEIVDFVMSVPERLKSLIPTFGGAGKSLIQSFMNGFRSVGSFIGDVAGDIVGAVKGFLNKAIDRINSGIATIDAILPGDLGRIPRLAEGAFVPKRPGGILANIGEGNEDEWVLPQSKLDAMTGGTTITFGPNAININFSGALPTEAEAQTIGETIGQNLASMIARRNLRAQVRAI